LKPPPPPLTLWVKMLWNAMETGLRREQRQQVHLLKRRLLRDMQRLVERLQMDGVQSAVKRLSEARGRLQPMQELT
jgi:hypothetical protein